MCVACVHISPCWFLDMLSLLLSQVSCPLGTTAILAVVCGRATLGETLPAVTITVHIKSIFAKVDAVLSSTVASAASFNGSVAVTVVNDPIALTVDDNNVTFCKLYGTQLDDPVGTATQSTHARGERVLKSLPAHSHAIPLLFTLHGHSHAYTCRPTHGFTSARSPPPYRTYTHMPPSSFFTCRAHRPLL